MEMNTLVIVFIVQLIFGTYNVLFLQQAFARGNQSIFDVFCFIYK